MNFSVFKEAVDKQMGEMGEHELFRVDTTKDELWQTYLNSFPSGANPIFRERTEHDCQCCKQFIRAAGDMVAIIDNKLVSIWDINIGGYYQVVADALSKLVKSKNINDIFFHRENILGTDYNHQLLENGRTIRWHHFYYKLLSKFVKQDAGTALSNARSNKEVFKRSLEEISLEAIETVLELIEQKSIYRGEEHKPIVESLLFHKNKYDKTANKDNYCWLVSAKLRGAARIKNTVIGTLLIDVSEGVDLDHAVRSFETKVAPTNYKRPSALITKKMIENAQDKIKELGFEESLHRRYAVAEDITVNNVLFADRSMKKSMNVFDEMIDEAPEKVGKLDKVDEVDIDTFINDILPKADSIALMLENRHANNMMSLIAPINPDSKRMFKWNNNFSWAYNGEVADSIRERVKNAGGDIEGVLRYSIQWNDGDNNPNDFDAHCIEPNGNLIFYPNKRHRHPSSGMLDVDIVKPGKKIAVENITWNNKDKIQEGEHQFIVHNFSHNGGKTGFAAEIEYDGKIYSYVYTKELRQDEKVTVARAVFSRTLGLEIIESLPSTQASKEVWGIATEKFHKVSLVMNSPNHWDGRKTGNKHLFFILDKCKNDKKARGFFNEFLNEKLTEYKKVFEVLGSKMKTELNDNQLSGVGVSSTQRNHIYCKVSGSFKRTIRINL